MEAAAMFDLSMFVGAVLFVLKLFENFTNRFIITRFFDYKSKHCFYYMKVIDSQSNACAAKKLRRIIFIYDDYCLRCSLASYIIRRDWKNVVISRADL